MKQIIVMRTDLGMGAGKMVAQGAHASVAVVTRYGHDNRVRDWLGGDFTKICLAVHSLEELDEIYDKAGEFGLLRALIVDNGRTVFKGVPTVTCCAIGPDTPERLDPVTGKLKLL